MNKLIITINGAEIEIAFGYFFIRAISEKWGLNGPAAVLKKFSEAVFSLFPEGVDLNNVADSDLVNFDIPFPVIDIVADVVVVAAAVSKTDIPQDDAAVWVYENVDKITDIARLFMQSMPRMQDAGKQTAAAEQIPPVPVTEK